MWRDLGQLPDNPMGVHLDRNGVWPGAVHFVWLLDDRFSGGAAGHGRQELRAAQMGR